MLHFYPKIRQNKFFGLGSTGVLPRGLGRVYQDPWGGYSATPRVCSWIFRGGAEKTGRGLEMEREERNINEKKNR